MAAAVAVLSLSLGSAGPAAAAVSADPAATKITVSDVRDSLPSAERDKWDALSDDEKSRTLEILSDLRFGAPGAEHAAEGLWSEVDVVERSGATTRLTDRRGATVAAAERSKWYQQYWTILGVRYTEITTTIGWTYSGSRITSVPRCYGTYVNYVPLRSIDKNSWSEFSSSSATCKTEWSLSRPLQSTVTGVQGLKVDVNGKLLQTWSV